MAFANDVMRARFDLVVLMTGVGVRLLIKLVEPSLGRDPFVQALGRARILARGPKPVAALRELGVTPWATVPSPNTWRELLSTLDVRSAEMPLAGARVAVQEYGLPNPDLVGALSLRGATVVAVPIYRWAMPEDLAPLRAAVHAIVRNEIDFVLLTAGVQLVHLLRAAAELGLEPQCARAGADGDRVDRSDDVRGTPPPWPPIDYEPSHPKMGFLVKELAEHCDTLLDNEATRIRTCRDVSEATT